MCRQQTGNSWVVWAGSSSLMLGTPRRVSSAPVSGPSLDSQSPLLPLAYNLFADGCQSLVLICSPAFLFEQTFWWLQACFPVASLLPHFRRVALKLLEVSRWAAEEAFHHHQPSGITNTAAQLFKELPVHVFVGPLALSALFIGSTCVPLS